MVMMKYSTDITFATITWEINVDETLIESKRENENIQSRVRAILSLSSLQYMEELCETR